MLKYVCKYLCRYNILPFIAYNWLVYHKKVWKLDSSPQECVIQIVRLVLLGIQNYLHFIIGFIISFVIDVISKQK